MPYKSSDIYYLKIRDSSYESESTLSYNKNNNRSYNDSINMLINGSLGKRDLGTNSLTDNSYRPYVSYYSNPFPSGDFRRILFLQLGIQWWYKPYLSFVIKFDHKKTEKHDNQNKLEAGFDIYFPLKTKI